ncbi:MAG TPA: UDP-N-acetylmuramate dehydrogenase [Candidatus Omnitrophota bacterium]|nr:UDP-N-acetylmuramate dehydrogenase [Candidatus Omnitrophota bacterium]HPN88629.1 UDP-N-acetylmuramate dehydrogenase [Candidatus Omnitrophota bacterium]
MDIVYLRKLEISIIDKPRLCDYTTFKLGGACPILFQCETPEQIEAVVKELKSEKIDFITIGEGSNLIVSDEGIKQYVIRYLTKKPDIVQAGKDIFVSGSTLLDDLASFCAEDGLKGLNFASGIPGTVAGAIVGNAGAYGKQIADVLVGMDILDEKGNRKYIEKNKLSFSYRESSLKKTNEIVLSAHFLCEPSDKEFLLKERENILKERSEKHPDYKKIPCAGSVFKNVMPTSNAGRRQSAGWFLDQAGAKNFAVGGASVFEKHANIVIKKYDSCKAQDVFDLIQKMSANVQEQFNLSLEPEVRFVGKFK